MRENVYRFIFVILVATLLLKAGSSLAQKPEGSMGRSVPKVVGMTKKVDPVVLDISPRKSFVILNNNATLRIRLTVDRYDKNRAATLSWGSDIGNEGSTFIQLDDKSPAIYEKFWDFPVGYYNFQACVYRTAKPTKICVEKEAEIIRGEPP